MKSRSLRAIHRRHRWWALNARPDDNLEQDSKGREEHEREGRMAGGIAVDRGAEYRGRSDDDWAFPSLRRADSFSKIACGYFTD